MSFRNIEENRGSKREASAFSFSPLLERSSSKQATPASGCTTEGRRKQGKRLLFYNIVFYLLLLCQKPRTQRCCLLCCLLTCYSTIWPEIKSWPLVLVCNAMQHQTCCNRTRPSILTWKVSVYIECVLTLFENYFKYRIWIFEFWHFSLVFVLLKVTCLVTLFDRKLQVFKNLPKWNIFGIVN